MSAPATQSPPFEATVPALSRRTFVALVSAGLAAEWLGGAGRLTAAELPRPPAGPSLMPGYLGGSAAVVLDDAARRSLNRPDVVFYEAVRAAIGEGEPLTLVSADAIDDEPLLEGRRAVLEVHGLLPPEAVREDRAIRRIEVLAEFESADQPQPTPFVVWSYIRQPVKLLAGASRCYVPLGDDATLRLVVRIERVDAASGAARDDDPDRADDAGRLLEYRVELPFADRSGRPRMRAGLYAVPLSLDAQDALPLPANRDWLVPLALQYLMFSLRPDDEA